MASQESNQGQDHRSDESHCTEARRDISDGRAITLGQQRLHRRGMIGTGMVHETWSVWIHLLVYMLVSLKAEGGFLVNITYVTSAIAKGGVCLDGSPPAYHLSPGFGSGVDNWMVYMQGGGWCNNVTTCLERKNTSSGSSKLMATQAYFFGILSDDQQSNPDFYNWNKVAIRYCDGSSYTGDVKRVDPATNLHYRGARLWLTIMEDLLEKGMKKAKNALLAGCSAGGLPAIIHCDRFHALFQHGARVKCLADGGYFINVKDITGREYIKDYYREVVTTHESAKYLPPSCTLKLEPSLCFFPQYFVEHIETPLFILNTAYDSSQIRKYLVPNDTDPNDTWHDCKLDIQKCSPTQLRSIQDFRIEFLNALPPLGSSSSRGMFINSCYGHCQAHMPQTWSGANSPVLENTTISEAVGSWFYDRRSFQVIDLPLPFLEERLPKSLKLYNLSSYSYSDSSYYPPLVVRK